MGFEIGADLNFRTIFIEPITNGHQFIYNMGGWFIIPLFMVQMFNVIVRKLLKMVKNDISEYCFLIISVALGIWGNWLACMGYLHDWWLVLVRMLYFIPFYSLGIIYKDKLEVFDKKIPSSLYFIVVFAAKLTVIYYYGKVPGYTPSWCNDFTEGPIMPILIGFLGIALWMRIATILEPVLGRSKCVNVVANNTYSIMMNQFLGFMVVKTGYALLSKVFIGMSNFDWISFKTKIWWYYIPNGVNNTLIIYVVAGLVIPILIQKGIDAIRKGLRQWMSHRLHRSPY